MTARGARSGVRRASAVPFGAVRRPTTRPGASGRSSAVPRRRPAPERGRARESGPSPLRPRRAPTRGADGAKYVSTARMSSASGTPRGSGARRTRRLGCAATASRAASPPRSRRPAGRPPRAPRPPGSPTARVHASSVASFAARPNTSSSSTSSNAVSSPSASSFFRCVAGCPVESSAVRATARTRRQRPPRANGNGDDGPGVAVVERASAGLGDPHRVHRAERRGHGVVEVGLDAREREPRLEDLVDARARPRLDHRPRRLAVRRADALAEAVVERVVEVEDDGADRRFGTRASLIVR